MRKDIILCGVGGQGTVLASRLISAAAMARSIPVMSAETIGMAQRGGSVFSHLRMGEGIYSPMIARGEADLIIGFEPGEAVRLLPFLKPGGQMIVSDRAVMPAGNRLSEGAQPDPAGRRRPRRCAGTGRSGSGSRGPFPDPAEIP